jgi:hypothetical protein
MSEILDDLNISSLKINGGVNFGGKFVGSVQANLEGGVDVETTVAVSTTTLITTLKLTTGTTHISLASGTIGQMKIIVLTSGTEDEGIEINLIISNYINEGVYFPFINLTDSLTLIYTSNGWVKISGNVDESTYG